jgi:hypothetical protein
MKQTGFGLVVLVAALGCDGNATNPIECGEAVPFQAADICASNCVGDECPAGCNEEGTEVSFVAAQGETWQLSSADGQEVFVVNNPVEQTVEAQVKDGTLTINCESEGNPTTEFTYGYYNPPGPIGGPGYYNPPGPAGGPGFGAGYGVPGYGVPGYGYNPPGPIGGPGYYNPPGYGPGNPPGFGAGYGYPGGHCSYPVYPYRPIYPYPIYNTAYAYNYNWWVRYF